MRVQTSSDICPKAACSVSEMAALCNLSRARFYELIKSGVMPPPCFDLRNRRPLYPTEVQQVCLAIRRTNTALDGGYVIFNNRSGRVPRPDRVVGTRRNPASVESTALATPPDSQLTELVESVRSLGITASDTQIKAAITTCYPNGLPDGGFDVAVRTVFRQLRKSNAA